MTHLSNDERLSLAGRLDLLEDSGVITPEARRVTSATIGRIEAYLLVTLDDESGGPLVTHIAVALSRIERNEPPPELPEIVAQVAERLMGVRDLRVQRLGFAPVTCPTSPVLEHLFYPNARTIAAAARDLVEGSRTGWIPRENPDFAKVEFKGPF